jgi:large subunit ribosomal protein L15
MKKLLSELKPPRGAVRGKKRLGRGEASGLGKTAGRGHKGQKARSGGYHKLGFEGGQMPLIRRLPKRGFTNIFKKEYAVLNIKDLEGIPDGTQVDAAYLKKSKKIKKTLNGLKILGEGEIKAKLNIVAAKVTQSAREKIEKAGGKVEILAEKKPPKKLEKKIQTQKTQIPEA